MKNPKDQGGEKKQKEKKNLKFQFLFNEKKKRMIDLGGGNISNQLPSLFPYFTTYNNLIEINIGGNNISSRINKFLDSIIKNTNLKRLNINSNLLGNSELEKISCFLKENTTLEYLDLSFNRFDEIGFISLFLFIYLFLFLFLFFCLLYLFLFFYFYFCIYFFDFFI